MSQELTITVCEYCTASVRHPADMTDVICPVCKTILIHTSAEQHENHSGETGHAPRGRAKLFKS
jgi:hypothetical protein